MNELAITEHSKDEVWLRHVIADFETRLRERTDHHLGYPYNLEFDYGDLVKLQHYSINNLGDPFLESNYGVHSREFEIAVLDWFAALWEIPKEDYWGYVTNCGTEGNLHGILVGRENLPGAILYASEDSHYSVFKAARMYKMDLVKVRSTPSGEMDYMHLEERLFENRPRPAVINLNIGTTVKGAVDNVDRAIDVLTRCGYKERDDFYIHCDGALFGLMLPFIQNANTAAAQVTFRKPIGSISVSGHKFCGSPIPCGVIITRQTYIAALANDVEYLNSRDATIMGSRNGHTPIYMWYTLCRKSVVDITNDVSYCLELARWFRDELCRHGIRNMLNDLSSTVVFERPKDEGLIKKWQLACQGQDAHVVVMPNITKCKLDAFLSELLAAQTAWSCLD